MNEPDPGDTVARATGAPIERGSPYGVTVVRQAAGRVALPLHATMAWLAPLAQPMPGEVHLLTGDPGAAQVLALQVALALGRQGRRTLALILVGGVQGLQNRVRSLTTGWPTADAIAAAGNVSGFDGAGSLREVANLIDMAVDVRRGTHGDADLVLLDPVACTLRSSRNNHPCSEQFARCVSPCRENGKAVLAVVTGPDEAVFPLLAEGDAAWRIEPRGRRFELTIRHMRGGASQSILLDQDPVSGEFRPAKIAEPFPVRARAWAGGEMPIVDVEALLRPADGQRPRAVGHGIPDRRVELAMALLAGVSILDLQRSAWDAEALLTGDGPFGGFMGLALAVALAGSLINKPVPEACLFCGEVGLDRRVRPLSPALMESITFAVAAGRDIRPATRLFVAPRTAAALDGVACAIVPTPSLDAAVLHLWPELH